MYAWPKFHGSSPYCFRENDLNTKKFTPQPTTTTPTPRPEKQYICLTSASQARQKLRYRFFSFLQFWIPMDFFFWIPMDFFDEYPLIFHAKMQPKISCGSGEKVLLFLPIFSNGGHLGYSTWPNFIILRPLWQVMLHVKFENCRCNSFIEKDVWIFVFKCWRMMHNAQRTITPLKIIRE